MPSSFLAKVVSWSYLQCATVQCIVPDDASFGFIWLTFGSLQLCHGEVSIGGAGRSQEFLDVIGNKKTRKRRWEVEDTRDKHGFVWLDWHVTNRYK